MDRVEGVKLKLNSHNIDAIFITSPYNISYLTNVFPSSVEEREYYLFITKLEAYLIAPKMFMLAIKENAGEFTYIEITGEKGLFENILEICNKENIKSVGFEEHNLLYKEFAHLEQSLEGIELVALEDFIDEERQKKDEKEIEKIKRACEITDQCFKLILGKIELNVTERELASQIEFYLTHFGGNAFKPIVAFGKNAAIPHHISDGTKLKRNSFVLFDLGARFEGYCADMSRTIYFGNPSEEEKTMYRTVRESQQLALDMLKEWKRKDFQVSHLHESTESYIERNGFDPFPHSLGHGIGLEVHEAPTISKYSEGNEFKEGMVITIEPGIYKQNIGGVRIEDDILLTEDGYEILTKSPKELTVIE